MGDLNGRLPAVKAWDDGTTEMEQECVPMWHLGCEAINALEAELKTEVARKQALFEQAHERAKEAEAKLAALKGRRCWTCRAHVYLLHGGNAYSTMKTHACPMFGKQFEADGFCHRWATRP